ncbi:MAG: hypothetical protein ACREK8_08270, partial [Gemmatimonadales bacterium]
MAVTAPPGTTTPTAESSPKWTLRDAEKLYNMRGWGLGYFRINDEGHVTVHPDGTTGHGIDLYHIA